MHPRHWKHHHHHWDDGMRRGWILRWRLQRRIFFTLASAIVITVVTGALVLHSLGFAVHKPASHVAGGIFIAFFILWTFSRFMARRIASPMSEIERVAREIGAGNIHARIAIDRRMRMGEFPVLAHALNDMAERLEKQLSDQRALLATVSHEIRTPLARMRLLVEFARDEADEKRRTGHLDELDKEVVGVDALVSELLAASRIDFGALRRTELIAYDVAKQALERVGPPQTMIDDQSEGATFLGDATLVARAVGNLLENAKRHAGGAARMRILERGPRIAFEVEDDGPGFAPGEELQIFQPFYRGKQGDTSSVGLGLALVKRIAEAHGGRAYARNREGGGALVGIELARA
ncbi:MAG TPA: HAMP domain-containing sensor histidine kinase [Polyangiaceae bacterium]